jgi:ABC-2 type transport system permease protein
MTALRDTWLIFQRSVGLTVRNPAWVLIGVTQPLLFLVLFGPLLKPLIGAPGFPSGGAFNVFVPGLLVQTALFSTAFVGFGLIAEVRNGVIERLRVTPINRVSLLLGRALRDILVLLIQSVLLVVAAIPLGLRVNWLGLLVVLGLLVLMGLLMVCLSYAVGLWLRSEDAMAPLLNTLTMPLLLLSGVLLPLSLAPEWLRAIARANPLSYAVDAARALFNEHFTDGSIPQAIAILGVLAVVAVVGASRFFSRTTA